jgi:transposase InsO family protein
MREEGLRGKAKGRFTPRPTDRRHNQPVAGNRLDRQFAVGGPRRARVGDIPYLPTRQKRRYLAVVIKLRPRQALGDSLSGRMPDDRVRPAFPNAGSASPVGAGVLFPSDRGSQYARGNFGKTLALHGFVPSMSRKGNCWDNAVAESFFATLKNEEVTDEHETKAAAQAAIANDLHGFHNPARLHSAPGDLSPNDYAKKLEQAA